MKYKTFNNLCSICVCLFDRLRIPSLHVELVHHLSLDTLKKSAESFCGICAILFKCLGYNDIQPASFWDKCFPIQCECDTSSASWQSSFEITFVTGGADNQSITFTLEVLKQESDATQAKYMPTASTDSSQSWRLIRQWFNQCTENHNRCNVACPGAPTRLLDISTAPDGYVRLVESNKQELLDKPYATLSHCWGTGHMPKTVSRNYERHKCEIGVSELPKSLKDGVYIALALRIRYLWIDSLCIVQDSREDWEREAGSMGRYYRYSHINITATGASDGSEGCFWERNPRTILPTEFNMQWMDGNGGTTRRYQVVPESQFWTQKLLEEPLHWRAWILQERILAPRVLHFGREQLHWECRELVACETYSQGIPTGLRENQLVDIKTVGLYDVPRDDRWKTRSISTSKFPPTTLLGRIWEAVTARVRPINTHEITFNSAIKTADVYRDWDAIVELYSLTALTIPQDKLVALGGIASVLSVSEPNSPGDGYLAGLWQSSLPSHLLWTTEKHKRTWNGEMINPTRYIQYIAPSWSWASISGKISLAWCRNNYDPKDFLVTLEDAQIESWWTHRNLENPQIQSDWGSAMFGQVDSGYLQLKGPIASVLGEMRDIPLSNNPSVAVIAEVFPRGHGSGNSVAVLPDNFTEPEIFFDTARAEMPDELFLLPIVAFKGISSHEKATVAGLVLQLLSQTPKESFIRVGMFCATRPRICYILKNMPQHSITVI